MAISAVCLLVLGVTYRFIADEMGVSLDTVKYHVKSIFKKAGVVNRGEFAEKCVESENEGDE